MFQDGNVLTTPQYRTPKSQQIILLISLGRIKRDIRYSAKTVLDPLVEVDYFPKLHGGRDMGRKVVARLIFGIAATFGVVWNAVYGRSGQSTVGRRFQLRR